MIRALQWITTRSTHPLSSRFEKITIFVSWLVVYTIMIRVVNGWRQSPLPILSHPNLRKQPSLAESEGIQIHSKSKILIEERTIRIMTWICREAWLMSDLTVFFSESVLSPSWIQVSFILIESVLSPSWIQVFFILIEEFV